MPEEAQRRTGRPDGVVLDGGLLRTRRTELGLSQRGLAELAGIGVRTVRTAEIGQPVSPETAKAIATTLGLAYVEVLKPSASSVRSRLESHGLAPLTAPDTWIPVAAHDRLRSALEQGPGVVCVEGPSGVGKTTLVRRVLHELADTWPDGAVWVSAARLETDEHVDHIRAELAECLGFGSRLPSPEVVSAEGYTQAFRRYLWRWSRILVLDDLTDPELLRAFYQSEPEGTVVVTTQSRWVAESIGGQRVVLEPWTNTQVRALLDRTVDPSRLASDPEGTEGLIQVIGGLPLHAQLAASGLRRTRHQTVADYTSRIEASIKESQGAPAHGAPVEPLVAGLMQRLGRTLPAEALAALRSLSVFGAEPFGEHFAIAALGLPAAQVRAHLDALGDAYLLRSTGSGSETRFRIDDRALGTWGLTAPQDTLPRLLGLGRDLILPLSENLRQDHASVALKGHIPALRMLFSHITAAVFDDTAPPRSPSALSAPRLFLQGIDNLPEILRGLTPLVRMSPPRGAGLWLAAGLSVARARRQARAYLELSWLLAWWWYLHGEDAEAACAWAAEAASEATRLGPPDLAVSMQLHAGMLHRAWTGLDEAESYYIEAARLAESTEVDSGMHIGALTCRSSSLVFGRATPDWEGALALAERALAIPPDSPRGRVVRAGAALNVAVLRHELGHSPVPLDEVSAAIDLLCTTLANPTIIGVALAHLLERLGGPAARPIEGRQLFLSAEKTTAEADLQLLWELTAYRDAPSAGRPNDSARFEKLGHLGPFIVAGFPLNTPPYPSFDVFLPVDGLLDLLAGPDGVHALRFVAAVRGSDHPVYRAVQELRRG